MPLAERGLALFVLPEFRAQQFLDHHIAAPASLERATTRS